MEQEVNLTAINPYAIGEQVLGKKVQWDKLEDPEETLASIFNVPKKELFAHDSILINPMLSEKREVLSADKAQDRLKQYLEGKTVKRLAVTKGTVAKRITLKDIPLRTLEAIFDRNKLVPITSVEWNPANTVWLDKGDYFEDVAEMNDPIQGGLGDCYFIAALSSVAWSRPYAIINATSPYTSDESPMHQVSFYNNNGVKENVEVNELCPCSSSTQRLLYATSLDEGEIWPGVMEKAYVKWRTGNTTQKPNYPAIAGGDPVEACRQLIGGKKTYKYTSSTTAAEITSFIKSNSLQINSYHGKTVNPMVAWTPSSQPKGCDYEGAHIVASHAYSILGWVTSNGSSYVVLRNPWGVHPGVIDNLGGSFLAPFNGVSHGFSYGQNGVFAMGVSTFKRYFYGLGVSK